MPPIDLSAPKPNFFIVGAMKCGTTAWYEYLRSHPDIFMPSVKEPCYFATDLPNWRRISSETEYSKLFAEAREATAVGEASAIYLMSETAAKMIMNYNADAKILIFLRDQEEYLLSLHNQFLSEFADDIADFETVWRLSGRRPPETIPVTSVEPKALDYRAMGRFHEQVSRYLDAFPPEQVRVIRFREWIDDPRATYLRILEFLGVPDDGRDQFPRINRGVTYRSRSLVRFLYYPPNFARKTVRFLKRLTGMQGRSVGPAAEKAIALLSSSGYQKQISPQLSEEIRLYYAEENRLLEERLQQLRVCLAPHSSSGIT